MEKNSVSIKYHCENCGGTAFQIQAQKGELPESLVSAWCVIAPNYHGEGKHQSWIVLAQDLNKQPSSPKGYAKAEYEMQFIRVPPKVFSKAFGGVNAPWADNSSSDLEFSVQFDGVCAACVREMVEAIARISVETHVELDAKRAAYWAKSISNTVEHLRKRPYAGEGDRVFH